MAEGARITIDAQLQFRHDVEANWLAADPILKVGEPAYTIGYSDRFKLGDGQSKWSELPYLQLGSGGGGGGSQAYESLAWSAIKTLNSGDASVLAQAYAVKQAYTELKSLIPNLADYYTKEQINALIPSLEGYATEAWVLGRGYATESFVNTKIADLINGAPTTLDTLKEIADAFAQSQDVIEALDEAIGKKANQSDLTALAARVAANEGNITSLSSNKLDKSIWDSVFEIDANGNLRAKVGIYSTSFISARTSDPSAGGGSGGEGGAFSLYTWDQVKAMTAEVGGVAPTAYALKQAYNELVNATPTLSWNNIQDKPIFANVATSGSYSDLIGRPTSLSDLANDVGYITSAALGGLASESWVSNNYLAKSGGTITSTSNITLTLNSTHSSSQNVIALQAGGNAVSYMGYYPTYGVYIQNYAVSGTPFINITSDGSLKRNNSDVFYHSGNSNLPTVPWICNTLTANGTISASGGTLTDILFLKYANPRIVFQEADGTTKGTIGFYYGELSTYINNELLPIIHSGNIGSYNAGSATKLATSRTIWGQSFDGTADIPMDSVGTMRYLFFRNAANNNPAGYIGRGGSSDNIEIQAYGAYNLDLGTNSSVNMRIVPSGNILMGTTTDSGYKLDVAGRTHLGAYIGNGEYVHIGPLNFGIKIETRSNGNTYFQSQRFDGTTAYYKIVLQELGGNVGIGTAEPEYKLDVNGDIRIQPLYASLVFEQTAYLKSYGNKRFLIHNQNGLFLGYETTEVDTLIYGKSISLNANTSIAGDLTASGTIYSAVGLYTPGYLSARSTAGASDRNLKTNITPVRNALAYILGTKYVSFDWKDTGEHSVGIIAQDELIREWSCLVQKYNEHYSYQYTQHTALIGSALQEEDKKVEALKAEMATLKTEVQRLRNERQLWQQ